VANEEAQIVDDATPDRATNDRAQAPEFSPIPLPSSQLDWTQWIKWDPNLPVGNLEVVIMIPSYEPK
jgi:hypothetical protein